MSINDNIKFEIYETLLMKDHIRTIIYKGKFQYNKIRKNIKALKLAYLARK